MKPHHGPGPEGTPNESRRRFLLWLWRLPVLAVVAGAGYGLYELLRHLSREMPEAQPNFEPRPARRLASLRELPEPWSSVAFSFAQQPAILLRLPEAVSGGLSQAGRHYAAFSRVCTHQGCTVSLNTNLEAIAVAFNYRSDQPQLTCPCHFSVFAPERAGAAVSGPAVRPLRRIRLELRGGDLYATGLEAG